jgi:hypothetical protein
MSASHVRDAGKERIKPANFLYERIGIVRIAVSDAPPAFRMFVQSQRHEYLVAGQRDRIAEQIDELDGCRFRRKQLALQIAMASDNTDGHLRDE